MDRTLERMPRERPSTSRASGPASRITTARGLLQLGVAGTVGIASLAEAIHEAVAATMPLPLLPGSPITTGVARLAYRGVRGAAGAVGKGGDALLGLAERAVTGEQRRARPRNGAVSVPLRLQSVLNGVVGDRLEAVRNPLALPMTIEPHRHSRRSAHRSATGPRVLFVHGLCMNDIQWQGATGRGVDFGDRLAREAGCRPLYLRYNTGLGIAENGRRLAALLEARHRGRHAWNGPLHVIAHSLGGLVLQSALAEGVALGHRWPERVGHVVSLGTPYEGALLERFGKTLDVALRLSRFSSPWAMVSAIRSVAIRQLDHALIAPLARRPEGLVFHAVAGTLGGSRVQAVAPLVGDGLVPVDSALARGAASKRLAIDHRTVLEGVGHLALVTHPGVWDYLAGISFSGRK